MEKTYIFMDFDGVTHPWGGIEDFRCLPLIEDVVRQFDEACIVISSDWRMLFAMNKLTARFAPDIRSRVIGGSPHLMPKNGMELRGLREKEAMLWLGQHVSDVRSAAWCAIDDAPGNWLSRARLVLTDFKRGFCEEDATVLYRLLSALRDGDVPMAPPEEQSRSLWNRPQNNS